MTYQALEMQVIRWAEHRRLLGDRAAPSTQALSTMDRVVALHGAILWGDRDACAAGLGEALADLIVLADMLQMDLTQCLRAACTRLQDDSAPPLSAGGLPK